MAMNISGINFGNTNLSGAAKASGLGQLNQSSNVQSGGGNPLASYGGSSGGSSGGGSVKGTTTIAPTSGNASGGGARPAQQASAPSSGGGSPQMPDLSAQIDAAYQPAMDFLNSLTPQLQSQQSAALGAAKDQFTGQQKQITDQLSGLNQQLGMDTTNFNQSMNNAYSQAQNQYNQLLQRNLSMYGGGSSAGGAISAILGQGYQQQTGQLQNQNIQGGQQLQLQGTNINQWGDTQNNTLTNWYNSAQQQVNTEYQNAIDNINQQKGVVESERSQQKLSALQNFVQQQSGLYQYGQQLQMYMQAYQGASPGQMGMTNFDPGNYASQMSSLGQNIGVTQNELPQQYNVQQQQAANANGAGFIPMFGQQGQQQLQPANATAQQFQPTQFTG